MRAALLHREGVPEPGRKVPAHAAMLVEDLGLESLVEAMARGDRFLEEVARRTLLTSLTDRNDILYRQDVLRDALEYPALIRDLYDNATDAVTSDERRVYVGFGRSAATTLTGAVRVMNFLVGGLRRLRTVADSRPDGLRSEGLSTLFDTVTRDLDDAYLTRVEDQLQTLRLPEGIRVHARFGRGLKIADPLLTAQAGQKSWLQQLLPSTRAGDTIKIRPGDDAGETSVAALRDRSLQDVANVLAESTQHVTGFFDTLRAELAFYVGCLNLHDALTAYGEPMCFPDLADGGRVAFDARGLYDVGLCLRMGRRIVGNDVRAGDKNLIMITGANQGGKSTFLRSAGISQLMTQCGMFVAAESLHVDVRTQLFSHFKGDEDPTMHRGKLDEELVRMSDIARRLRPGGMVLLNESFSSTNEREGSEIASGIVRGLVESGIKVFFVTHLLEVGDVLLRSHGDDTLFLRAERGPDGRRTYQLVEGEPLFTAYAGDLYERIFKAEPAERGPEDSRG